MDGEQFDALAKALGHAFLGSQSRRSALGSALALFGLTVPEQGTSGTPRTHTSGHHEAGAEKKRNKEEEAAHADDRMRSGQRHRMCRSPMRVCNQ